MFISTKLELYTNENKKKRGFKHQNRFFLSLNAAIRF